MKFKEPNYLAKINKQLDVLKAEKFQYAENLKTLKAESKKNWSYEVNGMRHTLRVYSLTHHGIMLDQFTQDTHKIGIQESFIDDTTEVLKLTTRNDKSIILLKVQDFDKINQYQLKDLWKLAVKDGYIECGLSDFPKEFIDKLLTKDREPDFISKWKYLEKHPETHSYTFEIFEDKTFKIEPHIIIYPKSGVFNKF